ncbi:MAG: MBG domain-containing protein, partial [Actinomycetes bacterium]
MLTVTSTSGTYGSALTLATSGGTTAGSVSYSVTGTGCSITAGALSKTAAGDCSVTATMAGNGNYEPVSSSATTVNFDQANQSALTVTSTSGTYGSALTLSTSGGTTSGSVTYVVTGTGCSESGGALSKTAAGDCTVTATMAGNGNYNAVSSSATTVAFARVALTVTADAQSKQYGATDPTLTHTITSGALVGSDSLSGSLTRASGEDVGTYAINQGTLTNSNYDITYTSANLTVTERPITVTADAATKQYGASDPTFTYAITSGSLAGQDSLTGSLSRNSGANVGNYALTIGTLANTNYNITFVPANLTITQRPITVAAAAKSKQYGASDPAFTLSVTTGSLVGSDSLSGSLGRVSGESVGTYAILRGTLDNTNYDITYAGALLSISQRPITVTADAKSKEYGANDPTLTYSVTTGSLVGSDSFTGTLSRATGESVGAYAIGQGTLANSNYDITYVSANLSVTQRAITVTADAKSKEYGATDPTLTYAITTGSLVGSDTLSGSLSRTSGESVGTYAIGQGSLANSNYVITYAGANLSVTERPITVTADAATTEYGSTDPTFTYAITSGSLVGQDSLTGSLSRNSGANVGNYA